MKARRLVVEALERRLVLDSVGLGAGPPDAAWQQVIVSLKDDVAQPQAAAEALVAAHGGALGHVYEHAIKGFSACLPAQAVEALKKNPQVKLVEPDLVLQAFAQTLPTGVNRIDAELNAIGGTIGEGKQVDVNVAIIDSGIADHPDLNVVGGVRFYTVNVGPPSKRGNFSDDRYDDDNGHGTHVAGIVGAIDNTEGVVGVAPGANLYAVKVLDSSGSGWLSDIIAGVNWVTGTHSDTDLNNDILVANMSLGGQGKSDIYRQAIQNSVNAGIVYVVAAGNSSGDIYGADKIFGNNDDFIPAAYPEVATITAFADSDGLPGGIGAPTSYLNYGLDDAWWAFSNLNNVESGEEGWTDLFVTSPGKAIDLVMPGVDIYSTYPGGGYKTMSGTSMAAPHAAGLAALYIAEYGAAENEAGVYAIRQALIDAGQPWRSENGIVQPDNGQDGYGWSPDRFEENLGWAGGAVVNLDPTVTITSPENGATVSGTVVITATAVAAEGTVTQVKFFVGENSIGNGVNGDDGWSISWDTNSGAYSDGAYTIKAVATDSEDRTGNSTIGVTVDNVVDATMYADLDLDATWVNKKFWQASAVVTVVDSDIDGSGLVGATVIGRWNGGTPVSGVTGEDGKVTFNSGNLRSEVLEITFTVTDVVLEGYEYDAPSPPLSETINSPPATQSRSKSLYDELAAWQAIEQRKAADRKDRSLEAEAVDYLMIYDV